MLFNEISHYYLCKRRKKNLFSQQMLVDLLETSSRMNEQHFITGMLLYKSGNFMQTIEGPVENIRQLYSNICANPAHHRITTIMDEPIEQRIFPDWSMGFKNLEGSKLEIPGYSDYFPFKDHKALPSKALLDMFWKSIR